MYPTSNVTTDTIVYIDYTSGTNIVMASLTGTNALPMFSSGQLTTLTGTNGIVHFNSSGVPSTVTGTSSLI